jgi:tetratricopeptide (TPR) repeat protein
MPDSLERLTTALAGRYAIEREVGAGGMAVVYLAQDLKHDRQVAIKVLNPDLAQSLGAQRFLAEIKVTARLSHPHILPLLDSGEADGFLFYVMPYIDGSTLRQHITDKTVLPVEEAVTIAVDVAAALAYAHNEGVVHRDIKPENILFSGGKAVVADFGIAQALSAAGGDRMTQSGLAIGTPSYMSPEQAAGEAVDGRSDEYALSALLYEMLVGEPPYTGPNAQAIIAKRVTDPVPSARRLRETIPPVLDGAISKALAKHSADRYPTIAEFATALAGYDAVGRESAGRNPLVIYGIGFAVIVAVALGLTLALSRSSRPGGAGSATNMERIVVFPFSVRGTSEIAYLGDGMVDLLSTKLDGAGNWRSADPRAVMSAVTQEGGGQPSPERGGQMVEDLDADLYVLGNIVEVGGSMLIDAALYRPGQSSDPIASASAEGRSDQVLTLVDELAAELLQGQSGGSGARLTRLALVTTDSLPALKSYLNGVREFRAAKFPEAWTAFSNAVAADTAFALAWYQLSVTSDWLLRTDLSPWEAADRAMVFSNRLSERDRQLLEALRTGREGRAEEAERRYRAILGSYPDDVEAWFQLGELQFHMGPIHGRQLTSSMEAWREVLRLEPDQPTAFIHMARVAAAIPDSALLDSMSSRVLSLVPSGDRSLEMEMLRAFSWSDSADRARAGRLLRAGSEATLSQTEWSATSFLPNIDDAIAVARYMTEPHRSAEFRAVGNTVLASLYMGKGEWQEAQAHLGAAAALDPAGALVNRALMELAPFREIDPITLRGLRTELRAFDAASVPPAVSPTIWIAAHNGLYPELRGYLLGLLNGQLRDTAITLRDLSSFEPPPGLGTAAADWRRGVLASAALAAGDIDGALVQLEAVELESWYQLVVVSPFVAMSRERFLLATLLEEAGRTDEALMWYGSFEHSSPHDRMYVAPSHLRRGRIHQRLGNHEIAADHYRAFIDLWRDADPEFQSMVEEAQARLGDVVDDER